jgi:hypothetical protein
LDCPSRCRSRSNSRWSGIGCEADRRPTRGQREREDQIASALAKLIAEEMEEGP